MNRILKEVRKIIDENMAECLPDVKKSDLEKDGAVFYMNSRDGTEFDWYVNDKIPPLMSFYDDKENLGAVKFLLYRDGNAEVFFYGEKGKKHIKTIEAKVDASEEEILALAVALKSRADDKSVWNSDIESIDTDTEIEKDKIDAFKGREENYAVLRNRKKLFNSSAYVSKKIIDDGWKVGYMERFAPHNEMDSGWFFAAGNEEGEYSQHPENLTLAFVGAVRQQLDRDILKYIDMPVGTRLIRVSRDSFEIDKGDKEIYLMKR